MKFFKSLTINHICAGLIPTEEQLASQSFTPCGQFEHQSSGFSPVRGANRVHSINDQVMLSYTIEKKSIPASVIKRHAQAIVDEIKSKEGRTVGRAERNIIKDEVTNRLIVQAIPVAKDIRVWIDPNKGILAAETTSGEVMAGISMALRKAMGGLTEVPFASSAETTPASLMSQWLLNSAPSELTIESAARLENNDGEQIQYRCIDLDKDDIKDRILSGMLVTRIGMTFQDRITFDWHASGILSGIKPLDLIEERIGEEVTELEADAIEDATFLIMTDEIGALVSYLAGTIAE